MNCPKCGDDTTKVVETRSAKAGVRRRRRCKVCDFQFATSERFGISGISVTKKSGKVEPFSREKLRKGIAKANSSPRGSPGNNRRGDC